MKFYQVVLIGLTLMVQSCGSETQADNGTIELETPEVIEDTTTVEVVEEIPIEINEHLQTILDKSDTTYQLPFNVDTSFVKALDFTQKSTQSSLNFENGRYLAKRTVENAPTFNATYNIEIFCEIDSLKAEGAYEDYVSNLDIGMMQESDAYVEGLIEIDSSKLIVLWSITYSTYEACPFGSGTLVLGTLLNNYEVQNTMLFAEVSQGSDPPSWGETQNSTTITTDLNLSTYYLSLSGDSDEGYVDKIEETYDAEIGSEAFEYGMEY